jgi:hypothetical protein
VSPYVDLRRLAVKVLGLIRVWLVVMVLCKSRVDVRPPRLWFLGLGVLLLLRNVALKALYSGRNGINYILRA